MASRDKLDFTKAPALPYAPAEYERGYQDVFGKVLRQYFNAIDNFVSSLLGPTGGRFLSFPHIAAQDNTDQYATATNTATKVLWSQLDSGAGFTLNLDSTATAEETGTYKIDYSLQFTNTDSQIREAYVWLKIDGVNVAGSSSKFSIPNKHGSINGFLVAYSSIVFNITGGQSVALYWATNLAATSGGVAGVFMEADPAQTSPFSMASIPSAIGSITFISRR